MDLLLPSLAVSILLVLAGILWGIGNALGSFGLKRLGQEEFVQALVTAAILGVFASVIGVMDGISHDMNVSANCSGLLNCTWGSLNQSMVLLKNASLGLANTSYELGYYRSLGVRVSNVYVEPFNGLQAIQHAFDVDMVLIHFLMVVIGVFRFWVGLLMDMMPAALALGLFLRTIRPLREMADLFLVGVAIAYLLSPFIYLEAVPSQLPDVPVMNYTGVLPVSFLEHNDTLLVQLEKMQNNSYPIHISRYSHDMGKFISSCLFRMMVLSLAFLLPLAVMFMKIPKVNIWNLI